MNNEPVVARSLVDLDRVADWMDEVGLGDGPVTALELIAGGTQNFLVRLERSGTQYVLRRPPEHKRANSDDTMRREARVLAALAGTEVPHPGLVAACGDLGVIGAAFYLMEPIDGINVTLGLPEAYADPTWQREMGLAMADGLVALGRVDPDAAGLSDLGRAAGWLERQVERWRAHLASYAALDGYPGPSIPGVDEVADWLDAHRPASWQPGLIHGDYHFANVLFRRDRPQLAAIVDWELTTLGDPLLDLGHLLATWPQAGADLHSMLNDAHGLPSRADVISRYAAGSTRDVDAVDWYQVLACYRLGIILEGTNARADAGLAPRDTGDRLHLHTVSLFEQALRLIAGQAS